MSTQTIIVTGDASGIGLACTKLLLERGARVMAFDLQGGRMAEVLPAGNNLKMVAGDVSDPETCEKVVAETIPEFGKVDALINWGAAHSSARWDELTAEECNHTLAVNVTGSFLISQAAAKPMVKQG